MKKIEKEQKMNDVGFVDAQRLEIKFEDGESVSGFFLEEDQYNTLCENTLELNILRAEARLLRGWLDSELKFKNSFLKFTESN